MSNRLFQGVIHQIKDAIDRTVGVVDENCMVIACSELGKIGETHEVMFVGGVPGSNDFFVRGPYTYKPFGTPQRPEYFIFVEGNDPQAAKYASILSIALSNIKFYYDEKYDRSNFIKNIILDNILPSDIYIKSNELRFNNDQLRAVLVAKFMGALELPPYEIIQGMFEDNHSDYVINISEQDIVIVKEVSRDEDEEDLERFAKSIITYAKEKHGAKVLIGISSIVEHLKDLAKAYKEARIALEVGKVFDIEKPIMSYGNLGIGRLVYQLPTTLCEIFLQEVFKKGSLESLDKETLMTVQSFFENNLNVSETSRKLFVHRNTLVYRLEKIRKLTGLDLREFDHAVTFKVALMVKKYLSNKPTKF